MILCYHFKSENVVFEHLLYSHFCHKFLNFCTIQDKIQKTLKNWLNVKGNKGRTQNKPKLGHAETSDLMLKILP